MDFGERSEPVNFSRAFSAPKFYKDRHELQHGSSGAFAEAGPGSGDDAGGMR
jgi:hypothetical protein